MMDDGQRLASMLFCARRAKGENTCQHQRWNHRRSTFGWQILAKIAVTGLCVSWRTESSDYIRFCRVHIVIGAASRTAHHANRHQLLSADPPMCLARVR